MYKNATTECMARRSKFTENQWDEILGEPVTKAVYIYQRKEETRSPNSIQKRFNADFQF